MPLHVIDFMFEPRCEFL